MGCAAAPATVDRPQHVRLVEELAVEVIERLNAVREVVRAGSREANVDDVSLGWCDHNARHDLFALEAAHVRCDELYREVAERDVEYARARHIRQEKPNDVARPCCQMIVRLAVHEHRRSEPPHERVVRRLESVRDERIGLDDDVVQSDLLRFAGA